MKKLSISLLAALTLGLLPSGARAEDPTPSPAPVEKSAADQAEPAQAAADILKNGNMELDANGDGWPDEWARHKDATREVEDENHFIRLKSPEPGATVLLFQKVPLPAGAQALEMSWRQRTSDLHPGKNAWFDARIMLEFRDASDQKLPSGPGAPFLRKSTNAWEEKSTQFLVPEGATSFVFMPSLFQVETGTFDLDDFVIKTIDPAPVREKVEAAAAEKAQKDAAMALTRQKKASALLETEGSLVTNGNFEADSKGKSYPDGWGSPNENRSWGEEEGNHYLRLKTTTPGEMVMVHRTFDVPEGAKALEMTWRQRITGLKKGENPWYDARIMFDCFDASGKKLPKQPGAAASGGDTKGWVEKSKSFLVPEGTVSMAMMPALFMAKAGTFELDDIKIKPTDPAPIYAKMKEDEEVAKARYVPPEEPLKEKWPKELRVQGNRLVDPDGKEVWLQGLNAGGLETLPQDDQPIKSAVVGVDEWKANVIRVPVKGEFWFGKSPYQKDDGKEYREKIDKIVTLVANRGAYVALDLHRFRAPTEEDAKFWRDAATRYKDHPAVIFDLFNEPFGTSWEVWRDGGWVEDKKPAGVDESAFLTEEEKKKNTGFQSIGMQGLINAARETGAKNVVIVGGLDWAYDLSGILKGYTVEDKGGNGIMLASHIYPWKTGWEEKVLALADKYPIFLGEVGADEKKMDFIPAERQEDPATWVPDMLGAIQKYRLNWTGWCFHPRATPIMISDWKYTPTPFWGQPAKDALSGKQFEMQKVR